MVDEIRMLEDEILLQVDKEIHERGADRMDVDRIGEMVDMVKDLACAEKDCWESEYYRAATEAMEQKPKQRAAQRIVRKPVEHDDIVEKLGDEYASLDAEERIAMKGRILAKLNSM